MSHERQICKNEMTTFTENEKLKALAIVNIFETSRPFGDYAACTVLNDGAGVSYGISQFTHRSGSLAAVVQRYIENGGKIGVAVLTGALPDLRRNSTSAISRLSTDRRFKNALHAAAVTREMKAAQKEIAFEKYLQPSLKICEARQFMRPLSLAVIYDSLDHGSWEKIAKQVDSSDVRWRASETAALVETEWITEYVRRRHNWLCSKDRLRSTSYRTTFFLQQIAIGNWDLRLPMTVHGFRLTADLLPAFESVSVPGATATGDHKGTSVSDVVSSAAAKFDRVENVITTVTSRTDAAKSLWTTVIGTVWQCIWAIFSSIAGLPDEVWIVVAIIAAVFMLAYLYRQIELGRIREKLIADS
jgi:hypothetical protein